MLINAVVMHMVDIRYCWLVLPVDVGMQLAKPH